MWDSACRTRDRAETGAGGCFGCGAATRKEPSLGLAASAGRTSPGIGA